MRELRKLDSVEVVDAKDAEYELSLVTVKTSRSYAMSALLTSKTDLTWTLYFSKNDACHPTDEQQKETRELLQDYVLVHDLWVFTDSDIQSLASRVAAAVDVNDVERFRQIMRRIEEYRKKRPR